MPKLQTAADVQSGSAMLEQLARLRQDVQSVTEQIVQIGRNYRQFIDGLGDDVGDKAYADASLLESITRDKATLDAMDAADRAVVDNYFAGMGYTKV